MTNTWQLHEAKNKLSAVVERALHDGPQTITRQGKPTVMVVSVADYERTTGREKLSTILRECPVKEWRIERDRDLGRTVRFA